MKLLSYRALFINDLLILAMSWQINTVKAASGAGVPANISVPLVNGTTGPYHVVTQGNGGFQLRTILVCLTVLLQLL